MNQHRPASEFAPRPRTRKKSRAPENIHASNHVCHDFDMVMKLYDKCERTIHNWIEKGLTPVDDRRPTIFRGSELNRFHRALAAKRKAASRSLQISEFMCFSCDAGREPARGEYWFIGHKGTGGVIGAICCECGNDVTRFANGRFLEHLQANCREIEPPSDTK